MSRARKRSSTPSVTKVAIAARLKCHKEQRNERHVNGCFHS